MAAPCPPGEAATSSGSEEDVSEESGESNGDEEEGREASWRAIMRRNPQLWKVMLASGIKRSANSLASTLGIQNLRAIIWKEHTAQYTAALSMCLNILGMTAGGIFGRFGDTVGRKPAAFVFGLTSFLPAWALLVFGFNETGLWASCAGSVLSGFAVGSDALLVLANDAVLDEDRAITFGLFMASTNLISFVFFGLPAFFITLLKVVPNPSIDAWMVYQLVLSLAYFPLVFLIRMPSRSPHEDTTDDRMNVNMEVSSDLAEEEVAEDNPFVEGTSSRRRELSAGASKRHGFTAIVRSLPVISEFSLLWEIGNLKALFLAATLLAFSGDIIFDLGSQYFRGELGILDDGSLDKQQVVSVLTTLPPEILIIPGAMLVGQLGQRWGSLRLLKLLIPLSALLTAFGAVLHLVPQLWVVPLVCVGNNYAALAGNVPLKHLVAAAAADHVGQAMAALGMVSQGVSFIANLVTVSTTPVLLKYLEKPLWIYFLACGALTLLAWFPARFVELPEEDMSEEEATALGQTRTMGHVATGLSMGTAPSSRPSSLVTGLGSLRASSTRSSIFVEDVQVVSTRFSA